MDTPSPGIALLYDLQVREYFLRLVDSSLTAEEKYQSLLDFCQSRLSDSTQGHLLVGSVPTSGESEWKNEDLHPQITSAVCRAVRRMKLSRHQDGGWGTQVEVSNFWHTAYAVLFLNAVRDFSGLSQKDEVEEMLHGGVAYLEQHPECWSADTLAQVAGLSIYEIGLMVRCFYRVGRVFLRRESTLRVYRSIDRLYHSQNADGGWDAHIWGYEVITPVRVWSEVGATSAVVQALAETGDDRFCATAEKAVRWLAAVQNQEGSWNQGSCHPAWPAFQLSGQPALSKTCDALQGILAAERLGVSLQPYQGCIRRAVDWLYSQDKTIAEQHSPAGSWRWGYTRADYEKSCLMLEFLNRLPDASTEVLASNTAWLIRGQRRQEDDPNDGNWVMGHTARIALALVEYSRRSE
jgi:hypothetical protein